MKILGQEKGAELRLYEAGETLFNEGEEGDCLFVVRRGSLRVSCRSQSDEVELARLSEGSVVGEMSIIDRSPRSAKVTSLENTAVLVIPQKGFEQLLWQFPNWLSSLLKSLVARLRESNRKVEQPLVQSPIVSFALFLQKTLAQKNADRQWLRNRFHLVSRVPLAKIDNLFDDLRSRELIDISASGEVSILALDLLMVFIDLNLCKLGNRPYPLLELSPSAKQWIEHLDTYSQKNLSTDGLFKEEWEKRVQAFPHGERLTFSQTESLRQLGLLKPEREGAAWSLNRPLLATLVKTMANLDKLQV